MTAAAAAGKPRADEHAGDWLQAILSTTRTLLSSLRAQLAAAASHAAKQAACPSSASAVQHGLVGRFKQQLACSYTRAELGGGAEQRVMRGSACVSTPWPTPPTRQALEERRSSIFLLEHTWRVRRVYRVSMHMRYSAMPGA